MTTSRKSFVARLTLTAVSLLLAVSAQAASYVGEINWIEVWPSGNIAFKLKDVTAPCNGQFLINASMAGAKNMYAYLLTIKATKDSATVAHTTCGPADGYGGSYAIVDYLYYY
ncbi:MAG: hypothetical protein ABI769_13020 [Pseudomonadota bacterium]